MGITYDKRAVPLRVWLSFGNEPLLFKSLTILSSLFFRACYPSCLLLTSYYWVFQAKCGRHLFFSNLSLVSLVLFLICISSFAYIMGYSLLFSVLVLFFCFPSILLLHSVSFPIVLSLHSVRLLFHPSSVVVLNLEYTFSSYVGFSYCTNFPYKKKEKRKESTDI